MPKSILLRYIKFLGTSTAGTLVEMLALWLLSDFAFSEGYWRQYVVSPVLAFQAAVIVNFIISYYYVWKDRVQSMRGIPSFMKLYLTYNVSCTTVFLLRLVALLLVERFTGWDVLLCNITAMIATGIVNFFVSNNLVFRKRK